MRAQPGPGRSWVVAQQARMRRMKSRAVIHVKQMGELMCHRRMAYPWGTKDQPPAVTNDACRRATTPAAARIPDANALDT